MKKTFLINYILVLSSGSVEGKMRVKNKDSEAQAKFHLEIFLKRKHPGFVRLIISKCEPDIMSDLFGIFNMKK